MFKQIFLYLLIFVLLLLLNGCGGSESITSQTAITIEPTATTTANLIGYVYIVDQNIAKTIDASGNKKELLVSDSELPDCNPAIDCQVEIDGQSCHTNNQGQFNCPNVSVGEHNIIVDPTNSNNANDCNKTKETMSCYNQNQNQNQNQNFEIKVVPVKRAQHVGQAKQYRLNFRQNGNPVTPPTNAQIAWSLDELEGTIDQNGVFTPSAPTPKNKRGKVIATWNGQTSFSEVKVLGNTIDPAEYCHIYGNVTTKTLEITSLETTAIPDANIFVDDYDKITTTNESGYYEIDVPRGEYTETMQKDSLIQEKPAPATTDTLNLDFEVENSNSTSTPVPIPTNTLVPNITATPTNTPDPNTTATPTTTPDPNQTVIPTAIPSATKTITPTPTTMPSASPTPTSTNTPIPTPTPTPTPGWHRITNYSGLIWFNGIDVINSNIYAAGDNYCVVSTDNGNSWNIYTVGGTARSIDMIDTNTGIISSNSGNIYKTTNSGQNWTPIYTGTGANLHKVFYLDTNYCWSSGDSSQLRRSTNGGANWNGSSTSGFLDNIKDVEFISQTIGLVCGYASSIGKIFRSINGGTNWVVSTVPASTPPLEGICFPSTNNGWAVGNNGSIIHTSDQGINWNKISHGLTSQILHDVDFVPNSTTGWTVGENGVILHTTNGSNWITQTSNTTNHIYAIKALSATHAWAVGANGTILVYY